jgi:hypothetical protein
MHPLLKYVTSFIEINEAVKKQINQSLVEVRQILGQKAPPVEMKNHFLDAKVNTKSYKSDSLTSTIKNLEKELTDQKKINHRV